MPPSDTANLDSIPLNVLSLPDEHEQMQSPEVGDVVNYTVTGKVVSVDGGTAKVQRTSINGQDVPGTDADDHGDAGQPEIPDTEAAELRQQAGGMGSLMGLIIALFLLCGSLAQADGQTSLVVGNASYTNLLFVGGVATKLRCVQGYESGTTQFIQVFSTNGTPANGAIPVFSIPVNAGQYFSFDWSQYGADIDYPVICTSSTANTLTLGVADCGIQAIKASK